MSDGGMRTEPPTERRIDRARREGNFAVSREFVASIQFLVFVTLATVFAADGIRATAHFVRRVLPLGFDREIRPEVITTLVRGEVERFLRPLWLGGFLLVLAAAAMQLATTNFGLALNKLQLDFGRLNPAARLKNFPRQNVPQFLQALVLLPLFLWAVYAVAVSDISVLLSLPQRGVEAGLARLGISIRDLLWKAAAVFLVLGCLDLVRQRRRYRKDLRMSRQEIRDELKEAEGNPQTKARIRRLQRDLVRKQMMSEVAHASAVVVNPTHYAVALRYNHRAMAAPKVVAKGRNYLARRIRERARAHEVPVVENPPLARALYDSTEVGQEIPVHLYRAVAEILAYLHRMVSGRRPGFMPGDRQKG